MSQHKPDARVRFDAAAATYDRHDFVQREVTTRLLERLDGLRFAPATILDIGCATGQSTKSLHQRFAKAHVIGIDNAPAMLDRARRRRGRWRRRFELIEADAGTLPLAEASVDLVFSSLTLEWSPSLADVLTGIRRILRPGGMLLVATTGPDTLAEIEQAMGDTPAPHPAGATIHAMQLGDELVRSGFQEPVVDTDWLTVTHTSVTGILDDLERTGTAHFGGAGRARLAQRLEKARTDGDQHPATWEVVYASAWAPEEGQPIRTGAGEEASVSVSNLKIRRR